MHITCSSPWKSALVYKYTEGPNSFCGCISLTSFTWLLKYFPQEYNKSLTSLIPIWSTWRVRSFQAEMTVYGQDSATTAELFLSIPTSCLLAYGFLVWCINQVESESVFPPFYFCLCSLSLGNTLYKIMKDY